MGNRIRNRYLIVALLLNCFVAVPQAQSAQEREVRIGLLDLAYAVLALPDFVERLASDLNADINSRTELRQALEREVRHLFAAPELGRRLEMIERGSIDHTWRDGFADLAGVPFSPVTIQSVTAGVATMSTRRRSLEYVSVRRGDDITRLLSVLSVRNVTRDAIERRLASEPNYELVLTVVSLKTVLMTAKLDAGSWKMTGLTATVDSARALLED
jgi:hypothetical protein